MDFIDMHKAYQALISKGDVLVNRELGTISTYGTTNHAWRDLARCFPSKFSVCNTLPAAEGFRDWRAARVAGAIRVFTLIRGRRPTIPELQQQFRGMPKTTAWRHLTNKIN